MMKPRPYYSVIIPTHNRARFLPTAIESIVNQEFTDWELIIVDDGSTDNTKSIVEAYATNDNRVRYHYQVNKELNGARNAGVSLSEGKFCCFLDDDDYLLPNCLSALHHADRLTKGIYRILCTQLTIKTDRLSLTPEVYDNEKDTLPQFWERPRGFLGMAVDRLFLLKHPFDENDLLLDDFLWLNSALVKESLWYVPSVGAVYNLHPASRSATYHSEERLPEMIAKIKRAYRQSDVASRVPKHLYKKHLRHQYFHLASNLGRHQHPLQGWLNWCKGVFVGGPFPLSLTAKAMVRSLLPWRKA